MSLKREVWQTKNISSRTFTIGDLPKVPTYGPGDGHDLLLYHTKEEILQSTVLVSVIKAGWLTLDKKLDLTTEAVTSDNVNDALSIVDLTQVSGGGGGPLTNPFSLGSGTVGFDEGQGTFTFDHGVYLENNVLFCGAVQSCGAGGNTYLTEISNLTFLGEGQGNLNLQDGLLNFNADVNVRSAEETLTFTNNGVESLILDPTHATFNVPLYGDGSNLTGLIATAAPGGDAASTINMIGYDINMNDGSNSNGGNINLDGGKLTIPFTYTTFPTTAQYSFYFSNNPNDGDTIVVEGLINDTITFSGGVISDSLGSPNGSYNNIDFGDGTDLTLGFFNFITNAVNFSGNYSLSYEETSPAITITMQADGPGSVYNISFTSSLINVAPTDATDGVTTTSKIPIAQWDQMDGYFLLGLDTSGIYNVDYNQFSTIFLGRLQMNSELLMWGSNFLMNDGGGMWGGDIQMDNGNIYNAYRVETSFGGTWNAEEFYPASGISTDGWDINTSGGNISLGGGYIDVAGGNIINGNTLGLKVADAPAHSTLEIGDVLSSDWSSHIRFTRIGTPSADTRIAVAYDGLIFRNLDETATTMFSFRDPACTHILDMTAGGRSLFNEPTDDTSSSVQIGNGSGTSLRTEGDIRLDGINSSTGNLFLGHGNIYTTIATDNPAVAASGSITLNNAISVTSGIEFVSLGFIVTLDTNGTIYDNIGSTPVGWTPYIAPTSATGQIEVVGDVTDGDTVTINGNVYTFSGGFCTFGMAASHYNLGDINSQAGALFGQMETNETLISTSAINNVISITYNAIGPDGNSFPMSTTSSVIIITGLSGGAYETGDINGHDQAAALNSFLSVSPYSDHFTTSYFDGAFIGLTATPTGAAWNGEIIELLSSGNFTMNGMSGGSDEYITYADTLLYDAFENTFYFDPNASVSGDGDGNITFSVNSATGLPLSGTADGAIYMDGYSIDTQGGNLYVSNGAINMQNGVIIDSSFNVYSDGSLYVSGPAANGEGALYLQYGDIHTSIQTPIEPQTATGTIVINQAVADGANINFTSLGWVLNMTSGVINDNIGSTPVEYDIFDIVAQGTALATFININPYNGRMSASFDGIATITLTAASSGDYYNDTLTETDGSGSFFLSGISGGTDLSYSYDDTLLYESSTAILYQTDAIYRTDESAILDDMGFYPPQYPSGGGDGSPNDPGLMVDNSTRHLFFYDGISNWLDLSSATAFTGGLLSSDLMMAGNRILMDTGAGSGGGDILMDGGRVQFATRDGTYNWPAYVQTGTFGDAGGGISLLCNAGYEMNWQNGWLTVSGPTENLGIVFANSGALLDLGASGTIKDNDNVIYSGGSVYIGGPKVGGTGNLYLQGGSILTAYSTFHPPVYATASIFFNNPIVEGTALSVGINGLTITWSGGTMSDIAEQTGSYIRTEDGGTIFDQANALIDYFNASSNYTTYFSATFDGANTINITATNSGPTVNQPFSEVDGSGTFSIGGFSGGADAYVSYTDRTLYSGDDDLITLTGWGIQLLNEAAIAYDESSYQYADGSGNLYLWGNSFTLSGEIPFYLNGNLLYVDSGITIQGDNSGTLTFNNVTDVVGLPGFSTPTLADVLVAGSDADGNDMTTANIYLGGAIYQDGGDPSIEMDGATGYLKDDGTLVLSWTYSGVTIPGTLNMQGGQVNFDSSASAVTDGNGNLSVQATNFNIFGGFASLPIHVSVNGNGASPDPSGTYVYAQGDTNNAFPVYRFGSLNISWDGVNTWNLIDDDLAEILYSNPELLQGTYGPINGSGNPVVGFLQQLYINGDAVASGCVAGETLYIRGGKLQVDSSITMQGNDSGTLTFSGVSSVVGLPGVGIPTWYQTLQGDNTSHGTSIYMNDGSGAGGGTLTMDGGSISFDAMSYLSTDGDGNLSILATSLMLPAATAGYGFTVQGGALVLGANALELDASSSIHSDGIGNSTYTSASMIMNAGTGLTINGNVAMGGTGVSLQLQQNSLTFDSLASGVADGGGNLTWTATSMDFTGVSSVIGLDGFSTPGLADVLAVSSNAAGTSINMNNGGGGGGGDLGMDAGFIVDAACIIGLAGHDLSLTPFDVGSVVLAKTKIMPIITIDGTGCTPDPTGIYTFAGIGVTGLTEVWIDHSTGNLIENNSGTFYLFCGSDSWSNGVIGIDGTYDPFGGGATGNPVVTAGDGSLDMVYGDINLNGNNINFDGGAYQFSDGAGNVSLNCFSFSLASGLFNLESNPLNLDNAATLQADGSGAVTLTALTLSVDAILTLTQSVNTLSVSAGTAGRIVWDVNRGHFYGDNGAAWVQLD